MVLTVVILYLKYNKYITVAFKIYILFSIFIHLFFTYIQLSVCQVLYIIGKF